MHPLLAAQLPGADTIRQFRLAAEARYLDGFAAALEGQWAGAIYLWGYVAEMLAKSGYFRHIGFPEDDLITNNDRKAARTRGKALEIEWPDANWGHNVRAWLELLVRVRDLEPGKGYTPPEFGRQVTARGLVIEQYWSVELRYHGRVADAAAVAAVGTAVEWLLEHQHQL